MFVPDVYVTNNVLMHVEVSPIKNSRVEEDSNNCELLRRTLAFQLIVQILYRYYSLEML